MRIMERMDQALIALEVMGQLREMGYDKIQVFADKERGTVDATIRGGRLLPPDDYERAQFNQRKILGVCYTVKRMLWGVQLWDSRNWDVD